MIAKFPFGKAPFWICVVALLSGLLVALTWLDRAGAEPDLRLVVFARPHYLSYKRILPAFEKQHGVQVSVQLIDGRGLQTRLQNAMLSGTEVPDVVEVPEGSMAFFARGPLSDVGLVDLTDRLQDEGYRARMVESRFSLWSSRGRVFAIPHDVHPVMLAYRADIVEALGIDVSKLETWSDFAAAGQSVLRDLDGDGVIDRYMIDLPTSGGWGLSIMLLQRGIGLFDENGRVSFNNERTVDTILFYLDLTIGPRKVATECGFGQPLMKAMNDGLALFYFTPDWRSYLNIIDVPKLAGKMKLMPLPAFERGGRRTSVWGGSGLAITRESQQQRLAWELAKFLYFDVEELGKRFEQTFIVPPFKDAWSLPQFSAPVAYYSGQSVGAMYAALAPETPPRWGSPYNQPAENKLNEAFLHAVTYYREHGTNGLREHVSKEVADAAAYIERLLERNVLGRTRSIGAARSRPRQRGPWPYLFLLPYLVVTLTFVVWPLINAAILAFHQTNGPASRVYVGTDNFGFLATDPVFHKALKNTTIFAVASVFLQLPLSLGLALLLDSDRGKAKALFRLVLFSPNLVGQLFVGILFGVLFTPRYGLINRVIHDLTGFGLEQQWLQNPALVMPAIVLTSLWMYVGFNMIYFLAALQSVDRTLIDAALIDGANRWQVFRYVTLPSIRHVAVFVIVTSVIGSYNLFELPLALMPASQGRGPDDAGLTVIAYLYEVGFNIGDLGLGSAVGWVVAAIIFFLTVLQIRISGVAEDS